MKNKENIKRLSADLHNALQQVPLDSEYTAKLTLYSKILIEDYNWIRVETFDTHDALDALETGARVTTSNNELAVKHPTGWVVLSPEGYSFTHIPSTGLSLPARSIPAVVNPLAEGTNVPNDSSTNGKAT